MALKKPQFPKRMSRSQQYWRSVKLALIVPLLTILGLYLYAEISPEQYLDVILPYVPESVLEVLTKHLDLNKDLTKKLSKKKLSKLSKAAKARKGKKRDELDELDDEEASQDVYGEEVYNQLWQPTETEFLDLVEQEKGIVGFIFKPQCIFCKNLALQLGHHYDRERRWKKIEFEIEKEKKREEIMEASANKTEAEKAKELEDLDKEEPGEEFQLATKDILLENHRVAALNADNLSEEFKDKHKIDRYPFTSLFRPKNETLEYAGVPLLSSAVDRLQDWLQKLGHQEKEQTVEEFKGEKEDKVWEHGETKAFLNYAGNARVFFTVSKDLEPLFAQEAPLKKWIPVVNSVSGPLKKAEKDEDEEKEEKEAKEAKEGEEKTEKTDKKPEEKTEDKTEEKKEEKKEAVEEKKEKTEDKKDVKEEQKEKKEEKKEEKKDEKKEDKKEDKKEEKEEKEEKKGEKEEKKDEKVEEKKAEENKEDDILSNQLTVTRYIYAENLKDTLVRNPATKTFDSLEEARKNLSVYMDRLQFPAFGRLYAESFDRHLKVSPVLLVSNQPIEDEATHASLFQVFSQFEFGIQSLWFNAKDAPSEAKKWFNFDYKKNDHKIVLYILKKGYRDFTGDIADPESITSFIINALEA